ncbi:MAG: AI-2E family transporter [Actinomycetota bacterium]|nr:AI-2E family transporter [Actinomycetota bacterium]
MTARAPERRGPRSPQWLIGASEITVRLAVVAAGVFALGWLLLYLRVVTIPIFVALLVTTVLVPPVRWLAARGWPSLLATWAVILGALGVIAGVVAMMAPAIADQFDDLGTEIDGGIAEIETWLSDGPLGIEDVDLSAATDRLVEQVGSGGTGQLVEGATLLAEVLAGTLLAMVMTFFFVKDGSHLATAGLGLFPARLRDRARRAADAAWTTLGGYVRGTMVVGVVNAVVIAVGLAIIGVPLVLPLAVLTALSAFFPLIGAVVAGAVAALVALVSEGFGPALAVVGLVVIVQQIEGDVLSPLVLGKTLRLHPLVVLLALAIGTIVAGIVGAFIAVPLTAVGVSVARALRTSEQPADVAT